MINIFRNRIEQKTVGMLKVFIVLLGLFLGVNSFAATITSAGTGNWSATATWVGGVVPGSGDDVIIASGHTITVNGTYSCNTLVINAAGANNGITIASPNSLNVGAGSGSITINAPTTSSVSSTVGVGSGSLTCGTISIAGSATSTRNAILSVSTGTITCTGVTFTGTAAQAKVTFSGAGNLKIATGTLGTGGTFTCSTGTVEFTTLAGGQTVNAYTYYNLKHSNTSGTNTAAGNVVMTGTLTTTAGGTFDMSTYALSGALTAANSGTLKTSNTSAAPITTGKTWAGTVVYELTSGAQTVMAGTYSSLTCSNTSGTNTASGAIAMTGTLSIASGGTLDMSTYALSGALTPSISGTLKTSCLVTPLTTGLTWGGTVEYASASAQALMAGTYTNLVMSGGAQTKTASGNIILAATSTLTLGTGTTLDLSTYTLTGAATSFTCSGSGTLKTQNATNPPIPSGKTWSGTVNYYKTSGSQTIVLGNYNNLTLSNTSGTNTASGNITTTGTLTTGSSTTFAIGSYDLYLASISGSAIISSASGTPNITIGSDNSSSTYSGIIGSGAISLTKIGTGTLTLSGASTYTGITTISTGTLKLGVTSATNASGPLGTTGGGTVVSSGASLDMNGISLTGTATESLTINGTGVSSAGALTNSSITAVTWPGTVALNDASNNYIGTSGNSTAGTLTLSGVISGSNPLSIVNIGATKSSVILSNGGSTYSGATTVISGTLKLGVAGTSPNGPLGTTVSSTTVNDGASLDLNGYTLATAEGLTINGTGISSAGALTNSTATAVTWSGTVALNDATNNYIGTSGSALTGTLTLSGIVSGSNPVQIVHTAATKPSVIFSNTSNSYTGSTSILSGTLKLGAAGVIPNASAVTVTGTFDLASFSEEVGSIAGAGIITTSVAGACTLTCGGDNSSTIYSGTYTVGSGTPALTKTGNGTLTLSGANTYTGATLISAGTIKIGAATNVFGTLSSTTTVSAGAAIDLNGFAYSTVEPTILNGGGISGTGGAITNSSATLGSYAGTITLASASEIEATSGAITLSGTIANGGFLLTIDGSYAVNIGTAVMSGSGGVTKNGTGTLTVNGAHTFSGAVTISNGIYKLGSAGTASASGPLGTNGGGTIVNSGGSLDVNGQTFLTTEAVTINGTGYSSNGALFNSTGTGTFPAAIILGSASTIEDLGTSLTLTGGITNAGFSTTFGGTGTMIVTTTKITGSGGIIKSDAGTFRLSVSSDYTGTTTVNAGRLENGASDVFPNTQLILSGGTYGNALSTATGTAFTETFGTLKLNGDATIDFATTSSSQDIIFANSSSESWTGTLTITDWGGTIGASGSKGQLFVGTTSSGLGSIQLSAIFFTISSVDYSGSILSSGEIVASGAPAITSFPSSICYSANSLIITGANFTGTTSVKIGGVNVASFVVTSSTVITATLNTAMSGLISIVNSSGTGTSSSSISVVSCATSVNVPSSGNDVVTCSSNRIVYDNGGTGNYSSNNNGYLVLDNSGTGIITLSGTYVTESGNDFLYIYRGEGTSGTLAGGPYSGTGTLTTLTSNVGEVLTIKFSTDGSVVNSGFVISAVYSGTCAAPTISSFTPSYGCANTTNVVITGTNFYGTSSVSIGGVSVSSFTIDSGTQITALVAGASSGNIVVTNPNGSATSSSACTVSTCTSVNVPSTSFSMSPCGTNKIIYDNGGTGNYSNSNNGYLVLDNSGTGIITLSGTYVTESGNDLLYIYRGEGTSGTLAGGPYSGTSTLPTITSTAGQPLTIKFTTDGSVVNSGFVISAVYSGTCAAPTVTDFSPDGGCASSSTIVITGTNLTGASAVSIGGVSVGSFTVNSTTQITATAGSAGSGVISVTTPNGTGASTSNCIVPTCSATNIPATGSSTIACGTNTMIYDNGGSSGNYTNSINGYIVLQNSSSLYISLSGSYVTESGNDVLSIYRGTGTGGTLLGTYSGTGTLPTLTSSVGEALTIKFSTDGSVVYSGVAISAVYSEYSIALSSAAGTNSQSLLQNDPITNITYNTVGATGATVSGLPTGVTGAWVSNVFTISGTPTQTGVYNYTITLSGGCGIVSATGTITVTGSTNTVGSASSTPTLCINTLLTAITHTTTGATGIGTATNLPTGVTAAWASNTITISGTPSASGTFSYSIPLTGGSGSVYATGTITVRTAFTTGEISSTGETICSGGTPSVIGSTTASSGGDGMITYKWQKDGVDIASSNSATYTPVAGLNSTAVYTRYAKDNTCNTSYTASSGSWTVTVNSPMTTSPLNGDVIWVGSSSAWGTLGNWLTYNGTSYSTPLAAPSASNRVVVSSANSCASAQPTLTSNTSIGDLIIESGSTLNQASYILTVVGNFTNNGTFTNGSGTTIFNGTSAQTISGTSNTTFNNLTLNNSSGLTVSKGITINGTLTFTAGNIFAASSSEAVTFETSGTASGAADTKCIVGYCKKNTNSTTKFTFPVGTSTLYRSAAITPSGTSATTWTAKYFGAGYGTYTVTGGSIYQPSKQEYWTIDRSGASNATVELSWGSNSHVYSPNSSDLIVAHFTGTAWENAGGNNISGSATGVVSSNANWSSYSPFTLGSQQNGVTLPITLVSFTAKPYQNDVKVSWQTASEIENDYFIVERSENGQDFSEIARIDGAGNSSHTINYFTMDTDFNKTVLYYRLKLISFNGEVTFSEIASVDMSQLQNHGVIIMTVNSLGQEVNESAKGIVFDIYSDGTSVKRIQF